MCMMQAPINRNNVSVKKRVHVKKKHIPYDKEIRMNGDPFFIDERKKAKKKKSFIDKLSDLF